ncbi:serine/threonine-protein kinase [Histoplasma capsulatum G186AR]|uniref:Serine/threonine-protein kinase n=1 Tax=Ajellomyces capsulatus (strain G186AR / H82 / ATCC MYA-2454 / RMSCC 2432) TaxID=447093 RepID=C0NX64_AJECG|nr:serine/threonine-protein kinase [Histoplasma capsulatum G186AR]EEH03930.1 serine/threonine-protein kinase [Histoplasma capsulatum G186AR]
MKDRLGVGRKRYSRNRFPKRDDAASNDDNTIPLTSVSSTGYAGIRTVQSNNGSSSSYVPPTDRPANDDKDNDNDNDNEDENEKEGMFRHRPGGRRMLLSDGKQMDASEDGTLTRMGELYNKILNYSVITRYFIYVLPLALLIAIPIIVGATIAQNAAIGGVRIVWFFTWVEVVWLSLWGSKIIAHYVPYVFQFLVGILMTRNPTNQASGDTQIKYWQNVVRNILFAAFVSTLILAAEKILIQLISIGYHRRQFDTRIKESKRNIALLTMLYKASRNLFPAYCAEFEDEDYAIQDSVVGVMKLPRGHKRRGSTTPMRLIQGVSRVGDKITAAFGNVAQEITGKQVFNPTSAHSVVTLALEKRKATEALARRMWMSFVLQGRESLYLEDIIEVLGADREEDAKECFAMLDHDGNGDVSLEEMILTLTEIRRVKKSINNSLHDVDQAINVLDSLLCVIVLIMVVLVFIAFLNTGFGTTLAAGATALLSLSFVFATTAQEVLGSTIFLFVKHAMDVGDRVDIGDRQLVVERISLLYTVFRGARDYKTFQVPNIILNTQWIENITRSKAMREQITLTVDFGTSFADIQLLKAELQKFVRDKENSRDFHPDVDVEVIDLGTMNKLELRVEIRHKSNWSHETIRATRRSKFMCAVVLAARKIPIYGPGGGDAALGDVTRPSYSVAISHEQAQANKDEWTKGKDEARMIPTSEMDDYLARTGKLDGSDAFSPAAATAVDGGSPNGTLLYRGASTRSAPAKKDTEASVVRALHSRSAATDQPRIDVSNIPHDYSKLSSHNPNGTGTGAAAGDNSSNRASNPPDPLITREPSTGRRTGAHTTRFLSPTTPVIHEKDGPPGAVPSIPSHLLPPPVATTTTTSAHEYFELTDRHPDPGAGRDSYYHQQHYQHHPPSNTGNNNNNHNSNNPYIPRSPPSTSSSSTIQSQMPRPPAPAAGTAYHGAAGNPPGGSSSGR